MTTPALPFGIRKGHLPVPICQILKSVPREALPVSD
jgi:hypothetical protein